MADVNDNAEDDSIVLVTGASGFIASQIVKLLLSKGYKVRGTVRSLKNKIKIAPLLSLVPDAKHPLELVEADLDIEESWEPAVRGCRYVIHTAHPFPDHPPKNPEQFFKPALTSTMAILQACHLHSVKRFVLTSSAAAIFGDYTSGYPPGKVFTEDDWTDLETTVDPYTRSKTIIEKATWNFVSQLPEGERFELAVLNPTAVLGPISSGIIGTISELVRMILDGELILVPRFHVPVVDVRDVALAHLRAMKLPEAVGRRTIVHSGHSLWVLEEAKILEKEFGPQGYHVPTTISPYWLMKIVSFFKPMLRMTLPMWNKEVNADGSKMRTILKITPIPVEETIIDMAYSLIDRGFVKKTKKYHGRQNVSVPNEKCLSDPKEGSAGAAAPPCPIACHPNLPPQCPFACPELAPVSDFTLYCGSASRLCE